MSGSSKDRTACDLCLSRRGFLGHAATLPVALAAVAHLVDPAPADAAGGIRPIAAVSSDGSERRYPIPAADGVSFDRANQVILVRRDGRMMAFNLACPHENTALRWREHDDRFQCPRHESKYRPDGTFIEGRATRNMDRLPIRRDGDQVVVDLSMMFRSDEDPAKWAAASVAVS
jgi:nitrite reductase/ring-hydroxylating ferredoxin subunit